jgi:hypothetical protein
LRARPAVAVLTLCVICALLPACTGQSRVRSGRSGPATPVTTGSSPPVVPAKGTPISHPPSMPSASRAAPSAPKVSACQTRQLRLRVGAAAGASGTSYTTYLFINTATTACTLRGYPGFSEVDPRGNTVGEPATWQPPPAGAAPAQVVIDESGVASFLLVTRGDSNAPPTKKCFRATVPTRPRVFPPGQRTPLYVGPFASWGSGICSAYVTAVRPGNSSS